MRSLCAVAALLLFLVLGGAILVKGASFATGWVTAIALSEEALGQHGLAWSDRDSFLMPTGIWSVTYFGPDRSGSFCVYVSRKEDGRWHVSAIEKNGQLLP